MSRVIEIRARKSRGDINRLLSWGSRLYGSRLIAPREQPTRSTGTSIRYGVLPVKALRDRRRVVGVLYLGEHEHLPHLNTEGSRSDPIMGTIVREESDVQRHAYPGSDDLLN